MHDITGTWCLVRARATAADGSPCHRPSAASVSSAAWS